MLKDSLFTKKLQEKPFLIMGHRGFWGGNIIQNTRQSVTLAFKAGADLAEIDVCKTKDGTFYLFHSGYEKLLLGLDKHFSELTTQEVDDAIAMNTVEEPSGYKVERLEDFLSWLPDYALVNIDRAWDYFTDPDFFEILNKSGKKDQLFIKCRMKEPFLEDLDNTNDDIGFVPIIESQADFEKVKTYKNINIIGIEIIAKNKKDDVIESKWLKSLNDEGYLIVANSENLGTNNIFFYGLNDDVSLFETYESAWGVMIESGLNVILTHWPNFVNEYRQQIEVK